MRNKVKDKLVGVYAPGNYDHTSVLGQTQEFSKWFWANHEDMEFISAKLGINTKKAKPHINTGAVTRQGTISKDGEII